MKAVSDCCDDLSRRHRRSCVAAQLRILPLTDRDLHVGLGLTRRKNAQLCLPGRRGGAGCGAKDVREIILAPVREDSRDEAHERVQL
jgi:hypothetical protein